MMRAALAVLLLLAAPALAQGYDRAAWPHWRHMDHGCFTVRDKVLAEESYVPVVVERDGDRCRVVSGLWVSPYTDAVITDAAKLDIDHLVPLAEAYRSGGYAWDRKRKQAYANELRDPNHLVAVERGLNRGKGDKDPARWMPPKHRCWYLRAWSGVKRTWALTMDPAEADAVATGLAGCR